MARIPTDKIFNNDNKLRDNNQKTLQNIFEENKKRNINNRSSISGRKFGSQSAPQVNEDGDFGHFEAFKKQISEKRF